MSASLTEDESIQLLTLSIVLASVHKFNATTVNKVFTANVLADYVNIVNKPTSLVKYLGAAGTLVT
jgi:hypothetical protein